MRRSVKAATLHSSRCPAFFVGVTFCRTLESDLPLVPKLQLGSDLNPAGIALTRLLTIG
jgi:hypothetical protein